MTSKRVNSFFLSVSSLSNLPLSSLEIVSKIGHFNFAQIELTYFALTAWLGTRVKLKLNVTGSGSGAAGACEPCQIRDEAGVSRANWVPPGCLPGCCLNEKGERCSTFVSKPSYITRAAQAR